MKETFIIPTNKSSLTEEERLAIHRIGAVYLATHASMYCGAVNGATIMCGWAIGVIAVRFVHSPFLLAMAAGLFAWGIVSFWNALRLMRRRVEKQITDIVQKEPRS